MRPSNIDCKAANDFDLEWNKFNYKIVNNDNLVKNEETFEDPIKGSSRFLVS